MPNYRPDRIFVERAVQESLITRTVLERLPGACVEVVDSTEPLLRESKVWQPAIARGKRSLVLARHRGRFFKACPAGQARPEAATTCCNYFVINYASNCHMECSYCYLQAYLNFPHLVVYANLSDLLAELKQVFESRRGDVFRVGTGELADSLALDPLTGYSIPLVQFFARQPNAVLEFKTKSHHVENLLRLDHRGKTVVSWSLSPPFIQQHEEHKTATIEERLRAAQRCVEAGYRVAFHLDPLIFYSRWERDYAALVERTFDLIPPAAIPWISVGSLRVTPRLKDIMRRRFRASALPLGELVPCQDGRLRYFKPIRLQMFQRVVGWIRRRSPATAVYTCMEGPGVWNRVFHEAAPTEQELGRRIAQPLVTLS